MRKVMLAVSCSLLVAGCAAKPHAAKSRAAAPAVAAAPAADPRNKVIVHIVSQHQTITVTSSPNGLLYSLKDPNGHVQIADATQQEFAELRPELYHQIKNYIAVHADDAPIPSAGIDADIPSNRMEPTASRDTVIFRSPVKSSDQFKQTSDRPFPTARQDAP